MKAWILASTLFIVSLSANADIKVQTGYFTVSGGTDYMGFATDCSLQISYFQDTPGYYGYAVKMSNSKDGVMCPQEGKTFKLTCYENGCYERFVENVVLKPVSADRFILKTYSEDMRQELEFTFFGNNIPQATKVNAMGTFGWHFRTNFKAQCKTPDGQSHLCDNIDLDALTKLKICDLAKVEAVKKGMEKCGTNCHLINSEEVPFVKKIVWDMGPWAEVDTGCTVKATVGR